METLDRCQIRWEGGIYNPDPLYSQFIKNLQELNKQRENFIRQGTGPFEEDVIITFNYDVMLDYAMEFNLIKPNYCLPIPPSSGGFKLLKLHGSLNWAKCKSCEHLQIVPASPIPAGHIPSPLLKNGDQINFKMVTHVLKNTECEECHEKDTLEPIIIPPTWSKVIENSPLIKVWETAVEEIKNAFQLIVIGYSMPPTDTFFQYLLTLGLFSNAKLHRVVVVNKDNSEDLKGRYKKVFSRSLQERGQLKFLNNKSLRKRGGQIPADEVDFGQFIGYYMRKIGSEVEWAYE
jgi:NAD-dependent SIR2 family protein deacetylase